MDFNPAKRRKLEHQSPTSAPYESGSSGSAALDAAAARGTSRPSTFVLQTQELLGELLIDYDKSFAGAENLLHRIKATIEEIQPQGPAPIHNAFTVLQKKHNVLVPFPDPAPPKDSPYKVSFANPARFNVVGSYVSRTIIKSQPRRAIDMIVEMPRDIFQDKDYLNLRYFYKRAYYLAVLAASVRDKLASAVSVAYEYLHDNRLLPVLVLIAKTAGNGSERSSGKPKRPRQEYQIRIIPCAPEELFPKHKLLPTSSCIRAASQDDATGRTPTPFYNSTLKAEGYYFSYLKVISHAQKMCPAFSDACMLGRIWLQQRGFGGRISRGGFGNFEWSLLTALLLQGGGRKDVAALSPSLSSTQIFKALIQYLATTDLSKKPLIFGSAKESVDAARESGPVMFDSVRQLNVAYKMSSWSASMLQHHAKWTHASLADQDAEQFSPTFIIKANLSLQCFDLLVRVDMGEEANGAHHGYRGDSWARCDKVTRILKRALGDRAELVHPQAAGDLDNVTWNLEDSSAPDSSAILVGIVFNAANVTRQVDHGPTVEEKEAARKFRQFWGEKAELRRFKDGSILESLIWTQTSPTGLLEEITRYILKLHLRLEGDQLHFYGKGLPAIVPLKSSDSPSFQAARQAFNVFERDLRGLVDLPLQIRQVAATAPELRFASILPPSSNTAKGASQPMGVTIYFEASGKWPESLAAIQRTKVAFLLRIGDLLAESKPGITCQAGLEETQTEIENLAFLDVSYEEGVVFRLRIHSDLEESLLQRRTKDKTLDQHVRTQGAQLLASFKRLYTNLPLHTQTISTFCSRFPALSPTIRLVKHWFNSHKLSCHFLEEMIELLALRAFLEPYPWQAPSSAMTGFLRTLQFLSRWDWRMEPLILDYSGDLSGSERSAIETKLEAWRKIDPGMSHTTLFVATSHDTSGTAYTFHEGRPCPSKVVATRMTILARSACSLVKAKDVDLEPRALFQPSLKDYDVVIHLNSKVLRGISRGDDDEKQSQFKNLDGRTGKLPQPVIQQPARALLMRLESSFSGPLVFFHGAPEDAIIAGIWNPQLRPRTCRVNLPCSFRPVELDSVGDGDSDGMVEVNREGIIAELARIGGDCIDRIDVSK